LVAVLKKKINMKKSTFTLRSGNKPSMATLSGASPMKDEKKKKVSDERRSTVVSTERTIGDAMRRLRHDPSGKGEVFKQELLNKERQEKLDKKIAKKQKRYLKKKEREKKRKENLKKLKEQREKRAKEGKLPF